MNVPRRGRALVTALAAAVPLAAAPSALAHSSITPGVAQAKLLQQFTLDLQAEKEDATTTKVEMAVPSGFTVETFTTAPGWKRDVVSSGSGEEASVQRVTWTGKGGPPRDDPVFHFTGTPGSSKTYAFTIRQTYSDNSVTDWSGPEGSEHPAAFVKATSSLAGGGGGSTTLAIVALVVGALGLALGIAALVARGGGRPLA